MAVQVEPLKKSPGRSVNVLDEHTKTVIRRKIHSFYLKKDIPALDRVLMDLGQDDSIPSMTTNFLWTTLKYLDLVWEKHNRKEFLLESDEIVCWRQKYLRSIKQYRTETKKIFYLDDRWIYEGYIVPQMRQDKNITSARQAFIEGMSTGIKVPSGKGKREYSILEAKRDSLKGVC